ncbi:MAG: prolyl oligopeptidase family serine peptidase [Gammaproteobacteria bacterium]|nr:prolyl oligopeptidase family serine peptidase [Gammaproteobacteria bacterium]
MKIVKLFLVFISLMACVFALGLFGYYKGWHIDKYEPVQLSQLLTPGYEIFTPSDQGPYPTVVGFHGCSGMLEGNRDWARFLRSLGYAVVLVDSMSFRNLDWPAVCAGETLWGSERAGDVIAAVQDVRQMRFVDPQKIILMGWSHGGWTLMDVLALVSDGKKPTNLTHVPANALDGVIGSVLFYPFCAFPAVSRDGWTLKLPTHFVFAEKDSVVPNAACYEVIDKLWADKHPVTYYTYEGIDHAFDMRTSDFYEGTLQNVPDATLAARKHIAAWLEALR